jgi:hypothetical protein
LQARNCAFWAKRCPESNRSFNAGVHDGNRIYRLHTMDQLCRYETGIDGWRRWSGDPPLIPPITPAIESP